MLGRGWGGPRAAGCGPPAQARLPHLLLEHGLDGAFPLTDALAQLRLLHELLRGADEELLREDGGAAAFCRATPSVGPRPAPLPQPRPTTFLRTSSS